MQAPAEQFKAKTHLPVLDGVRGIAILLVICVHFCQSFPKESDHVLWKLALWGQTGVDLFFVLSGFLITGILLDAKGSENYIRNFYVRRVLRIFPLYYLTLIGAYFFHPTTFSQSSWYWFYLQDFALAFDPKLQKGPEFLWSLAVEEHFYLVWPFLVLQFDGTKLLKIIAGAIAGALLCRLALGQFEMYYFTLARMDSIAIGAALAIWARSPKGLARLVPWAKRVFVLIGCALVIQLLLPRIQVPVVHVVRNTMVAIVYACGIVLAIEYKQTAAGKLLASAGMRSVGKYSYAMYMFHPFILDWMHARGISFSGGALLVFTLLSYVGGFISWHLLEKPILELKRYFAYARPQPVEAPLSKTASA